MTALSRRCLGRLKILFVCAREPNRSASCKTRFREPVHRTREITPITPDDASRSRRHSNACLLRIHVKVPLNTTILTIALLKPFVALGEVTTIELHLVSTSSLSTRAIVLTNPLAALSGLGCTLFNTRCLSTGTPTILFCAGEPQARKTTPFVRTFATVSMTFCVRSSQPLP
jgi:hypothetical protein